MDYNLYQLVPRGANLVDKKSKSAISYASISDKDLIGCGDVTHVAFQQDYSLNARVNCMAPERALSVSLSGYVSAQRLASSTPADWLTEHDNLVTYLAGMMFTNVVVAPTLYGSTYSDTGRGYVFDTLSAGGVRIDISRAILDLVTDKCDQIVGQSGGVSLGFTRFDPTTCLPYLDRQFSLKMYYSHNAYDAVADYTGDIKTKLGVTTPLSNAIYSPAPQSAGARIALEALFAAKTYPLVLGSPLPTAP